MDDFHAEAQDSGDRGRAGAGEVLAATLSARVSRCCLAYDGQEGLRQAQLKLPDLIVLDLMLPLKPGLEVCRELQQGPRTRDIPIIMVTAKAEESDELVGFATGADDYVTKPYSMKVLDRADQERAAAGPVPGGAGRRRGDREPGRRHRSAQPQGASIATTNCR